MNRITSYSAQELYLEPTIQILSIDLEETLAKSNTEHIIEDDDEYGWGD